MSIKLEQGELDSLKGCFRCAVVARYSVLFNSGAISRKRPGRGHLKLGHPSSPMGLEGHECTSPSPPSLKIFLSFTKGCSDYSTTRYRLQGCISSFISSICITCFLMRFFWGGLISPEMQLQILSPHRLLLGRFLLMSESDHLNFPMASDNC